MKKPPSASKVINPYYYKNFLKFLTEEIDKEKNESNFQIDKLLIATFGN